MKELEIYEIGYLMKISLKEEEVLSFVENLRNKITEKGGLIISEGKAKKQNLAYPIKKETIALFNWIKFSAKASIIKEIKKYLDKQTKILRFLIIKTVEETPKTNNKPRKIANKTNKEKTEAEKSSAEEKQEIEEVKAESETKIKPEKPNEEAKTIEKPKEKIKEEEIDKKIEELLGE